MIDFDFTSGFDLIFSKVSLNTLVEPDGLNNSFKAKYMITPLYYKNFELITSISH